MSSASNDLVTNELTNRCTNIEPVNQSSTYNCDCCICQNGERSDPTNLLYTLSLHTADILIYRMVGNIRIPYSVGTKPFSPTPECAKSDTGAVKSKSSRILSMEVLY